MTLVLSSSLGTTKELWDPVLPHLGGLHVLRYDHPGHGSAPLADEPPTIGELAARVVDLLDREQVERASFCGLSLGGCVGIQLALDAPERLEKLVLVCTSPRFATAEAWHERAETVRRDGVAAIAEAVVGRWFTDGFGETARYGPMLLETPAEGYARCCEAIAGFDAREELGRIEAPTLVVAGSHDAGVGPRDPALLRDGIPGARLHVIPQTAHLAPVERPEEFARVLLDFLEAP